VAAALALVALESKDKLRIVIVPIIFWEEEEYVHICKSADDSNDQNEVVGSAHARERLKVED
jgi:hypothetical protein